MQEPRFESRLQPVEFFTCNKISSLNNQTPTRTSVPCAPIVQLKAIRGTCKATKKKKTPIYRLYQCTVYTNVLSFSHNCEFSDGEQHYLGTALCIAHITVFSNTLFQIECAVKRINGFRGCKLWVYHTNELIIITIMVIFGLLSLITS